MSERPAILPRVLELRDPHRTEAHRTAGIHHQTAAQVRIGLEFLDEKRSDRPNARQSSRLRSSPGTYLRYSANSTLEPRCGLGCRPETFPCMGRRGNRGNPASRESTAGSRKLDAMNARGTCT